MDHDDGYPNGPHTLTLTVNDGAGASATATRTVTVNNGRWRGGTIDDRSDEPELR